VIKIYKVLSVYTAKNGQRQVTKTEGMWVTKPFHKWDKAVAKMKEHSESESHRNACQAETCSVSNPEGYYCSASTKIHDSDSLKNKAAIKCLL